MSVGTPLVVALLCLGSDPLSAGDRTRSVNVGGLNRPYLVHVPPAFDTREPTPVVLALHPFGTNASMMARISGLGETADRAGFLAVYPNGTGRSGGFPFVARTGPGH